MLLLRDVFKCKPGGSKALAEQFQKALAVLDETKALNNFRILIDHVGDFWTVVLESEIEDLSRFEQHMKEWGEREDVKEIMRGYMDNVESGYREVFRIL